MMRGLFSIQSNTSVTRNRGDRALSEAAVSDTWDHLNIF